MTDPKKAELKPLKKDDYYLNKEGLMVLTEAYLRRRGYCCDSGCLHCPYAKKTGKN